MNSKSLSILILIIILIAGGSYFYSKSSYYLNKVPNISWEQASIKITTNWGVCPPTFPCFETYRLNSEIASKGSIFHNDKLKRNLSESEARKLIKTSHIVYQNNVCTPIYGDGISENYELIIDKKVFKFGRDRGCKEMQEVIDTLRK